MLALPWESKCVSAEFEDGFSFILDGADGKLKYLKTPPMIAKLSKITTPKTPAAMGVGPRLASNRCPIETTTRLRQLVSVRYYSFSLAFDTVDKPRTDGGVNRRFELAWRGAERASKNCKLRGFASV